MAKNDTYDIVKAFEAIENELISSMIRNMADHKLEEIDEDKQWTMWQVEQLQSLEKYRRNNQKKFGTEFEKINSNIEALIRRMKDEGEMDQEIAILNAIKKGFKAKKPMQGMTAEFFRLNEDKLNALIKATMDDMKKAETAILRMADDQYRKIIFNAQVYANTGAGTYEKAVDMATKDMLSAGLNCVEYANGARHTLKDYADMAIRTASKRAYLQGEGTKRQEWGIPTVIVNKRGNPCPKCLPFCGKVLIDDVWSNGSSDGISPVTGLKYPLMSKAVAAGLYHPRCKDAHTTYFEGVNTPPDDKYSRDELDQIAERYRQEQKQQYAKRQAEKFGRLAEYSLDKENQQNYQRKADEWARNRSGQRIIRKGKTIADRKTNATNKYGDEITFDIASAKNQERAEEAKKVLAQLSNEYDTYLTSVGVGAKNASGSVDGIDGRMLLNNWKPETFIHEFAHALTTTDRIKLGFADDREIVFMDELKKIRKAYRAELYGNPKKGISANPSVIISSYADDSIDEFFAEAFAQAKMRGMGIELPGTYGTDTKYSSQVLELIDKHFKKTPLVNIGKSSTIKAGSSSTIAMAKKLPNAKERSRIINEAINAEKPIYANDLREAYKRVKQKDGCMDICLHGTPYYTEYEHQYVVDTETLAYIISGRRDFSGDDIRLLSCCTGQVDKYGNCVAQELANRLGVNVYAPTKVLNIHPDGKLSVGREQLSEDEGFKWFKPKKGGEK